MIFQILPDRVEESDLTPSRLVPPITLTNLNQPQSADDLRRGLADNEYDVFLVALT